MLIFLASSMKISQRVSKLLSGHDFQGKRIQKKMQVELWFLFSAHCLIMLYICTRFCENISRGLGVLVPTLFPLRNLQRGIILSGLYLYKVS